jgi:transposase-like protein
MALTIICPNLGCRSVLQVGENMRGQKVRCARCGKNFRVPDTTTTPQPKQPVEARNPTTQ